MRIQKTITGFLALCIFAISCQKEEGKGGTATIAGKIFVEDYDNNGNLKATYFAPKENVYLIYGTEHTAVDDNSETSYDGSYEFSNLYEGTYTVFAYSKCDTCASGLKAELQQVTVPSKGKTIDIPLITIRK